MKENINTKESKKTILVIEDELSLLNVVRDKLLKCGFHVQTARNAEDGLVYLSAKVEVGAIWLDHSLLNSDDGVGLVEKLKKNKNWEKIPIFVVTNATDPDEKKRYLDLGVDNFYIKSNNKLDTIVQDINCCFNI